EVETVDAVRMARQDEVRCERRAYEAHATVVGALRVAEEHHAERSSRRGELGKRLARGVVELRLAHHRRVVHLARVGGTKHLHTAAPLRRLCHVSSGRQVTWYTRAALSCSTFCITSAPTISVSRRMISSGIGESLPRPSCRHVGCGKSVSNMTLSWY